MKTLREIIYKTLVDNLNIDPRLLSRVESNEPISIELVSGEEIFISLSDGALQTFIEIPLKDMRSLRFKASKLVELLLEDEDVFVNFNKDKIVLISEIEKDKLNIDKVLSKKLTLFNKFSIEVRQL
ncbi:MULTISPECIES: hypothetical protein [Vibrio]|uniref:Uncharacterized protein n=6 Tax=Vibrio parahaemolyticus TaxID=670 RepID=B9A7X5_VIBPH|nr:MULTISPECIES: hypothetical protein [Vibrio]EFO44879.1 conserved hypothetical protein [Vibrio parahaemolyticus AQ4037]EJG0872710.1 hypothetical protein [Vibrio parahaemolyticus O3]EJG0901368.1 hypothetical protein [Vibrio parahaemolyticus O3:K56]EJG0923762.1 hypothetical protein [Vibrio parahaemolyticus O1:K68]EJG0933428.1 hypothetical protein [Vibrio parahaemolyticus O1]EJG0947570.1 hypothetical protein [Vibrio parahaemolyticus O10]EJG0952415.1 hypothetical protein [Vibrio parahaemolyticu